MKQYYSLLMLFIVSISVKAQTTDVVIGLDAPSDILFNGNDLYISEFIGDKISKTDVTALSPTVTTVATGINAAVGLALNGNDLYLATESSGNAIYKLNIMGSLPATTSTVLSNLDKPYGLLLTNSDLYFAELTGNRISKIDITQSNPIPTTVVSGVSDPGGLLLNGNDLYITEFKVNGRIFKIDITSQSPTLNLVATGLSYPYGLAIDGNDLLIAEFGGGKISKIDIFAAIPAIPTTVLTGLSSPLDLEIKANELYISEYSADKISKVDLTTLSMPDFFVESIVKIYPNPASEYLCIQGLTELESYSIYNIAGVKINSGEIGSHNNKIDINGFEDGMYFLKLKNGKVMKFVKN